MVIKVKLFAMLREKLPPDSNGQDFDLEVSDKTTITAQDIIDQLEIPPPLAHLVMVDGYHLLPDEVHSRPLRDGESLAIFPPVAGG